MTFSLTMTDPCFLAFLHHHCLQILYLTNFLIENVFRYMYLFHKFFLIPNCTSYTDRIADCKPFGFVINNSKLDKILPCMKFPFFNVFLSEVMRGQRGRRLFRDWVRGRPFVLYNRAVLRHKTNDENTHFRLLVRLQELAKRSDRQESRYKLNGSRVFNDFIVGVKSFMEVSKFPIMSKHNGWIEPKVSVQMVKVIHVVYKSVDHFLPLRNLMQFQKKIRMAYFSKPSDHMQCDAKPVQ